MKRFIAALCVLLSLALTACMEQPAPPPAMTPTPAPTPTPDPLAGWTLEEKVAQLFFIWPNYVTGEALTVGDAEKTQARYDAIPVGGFIFYTENIDNKEQTRALADGLRALNDVPVWIGVDMEGGRVDRFPKGTFSYVTSALRMARANTPDGVRAIYARMGDDLRAWGFELDFAPVADVFSNPKNTVIGYRAFGTTAEAAAPYVAAAARGLLDAGVVPVLKHFPGHGDTLGDTHLSWAQTAKTLEEMERFEFLPFKAGFDAGADAVMMAHILCPNVTDDGLPASLSHDIITGVLREKLRFDGVIITDSLNMKSIKQYYTSSEAAVKAIIAGADMLLTPDDYEEAYNGLLEAVRDGRISEARIDESVIRILKAKGVL
jgi:beta-N-acetylhexosaminidase